MRRKAEAKSRLRRWLEKLEAEGIQDPVPVVVDHAVELLHGTADDRRIWMKIANRGINSFMGVLFEFEADLKNPNLGRPRNPVTAFQARLIRLAGVSRATFFRGVAKIFKIASRPINTGTNGKVGRRSVRQKNRK